MNCFYISSIPPQNYLAEEILLGCILINPSLFTYILPLIKIESFFLECHQLLYINFIILYKKNKLHPIELLYHLSETENLHKIGSLDKIIELMKQSQVFISSNNMNIYIYELVQLINNNYIKRLMIQYGHNIIRLSYIKGFSSHILYNKASHYLNFTVNKIPKENFHNLDHLIGNLMLEIKTNNYKESTNISIKENITSGFKDLDKLTYGLPNGDLIVLAARPSMGKTSLAINITYNILQEANYGVCIFSLEMSSKQILNKLISIASKIPNQQILHNKINQSQWKLIQKICNKILHSELYIHDKPNISIDYIEYISKLLINDKKNINLIIIDYLQLIQIEHSSNLNRTQELSYITRKLKLLAQYLNIPILILSQLNRSIELRPNKEPILSDLKESGCINCNTNIDIQMKPINEIQIKNIYHIKDKYNIRINTLKQNDIDDYINKISILIEYIFIFKFKYITHILTTHNHKYLYPDIWISSNQLTDNITIASHNINLHKTIIIEYIYLKSIEYNKYMTAYDITMQKYCHFLCKNIILHNSIEQDADIVMMLYEKQKTTNALNNPKIIDIIISKNRNGPTGSCELLFSLNNTIFNNMQKNIILN